MSIDAVRKLDRALIASARAAGVAIEIQEDDFTRWASATFEGGRHLVKVQAPHCSALEHWVDGLKRLNLHMAGHDIADIVVRAFRRGVAGAGLAHVHLEILTVANA